MPRLITGQVAVTATRAQLTTANLEMVEYIVRAPVTNAGVVYLGDSTVTTTTGYGLGPGDVISCQTEVREGEPRFEVAPSELYVVGTTGDRVNWIGTRLPGSP